MVNVLVLYSGKCVDSSIATFMDVLVVKEARSSWNTANAVGEQTQLSHANASHSVSKATMLPTCLRV